MAERILKIDAPFRNGVRRETFQGRNAPYLRAAMGRRCTPEGGLQPFNAITDIAFSGAAHPHPAIYQAKRSVISGSFPVIALGDQVARAYDPVTPAFSTISTKDWFADRTGATGYTIPAGRNWQFTENHGVWFAFNKTSMLFKTGWYPYVFGQAAALCNTGAFHKNGSMFFGGFDSSSGVWAKWATYLDTYNTYTSKDIDALSFGSLGLNDVWVTHPGGGDLLTFLDWTSGGGIGGIMKYGSAQASPDTHWTTDNPYIIDLWARGRSGLIPMPWTGEVLKNLSLGDCMMIYGQYGATCLRPIGQRPGWEPVPVSGGFGAGLYHNASGGTYGPVAGNDARHLALDAAGELWFIEPDGGGAKGTRLGYGEQMADLIAEGNPVVSHEPRRNEFYISGANTRYMISDDGALTKEAANLSGIVRYGSRLLGSGATYTAGATPRLYFRTNKMAPEGKSQPVIEWVRVVGENSTTVPWNLGIYWRDDLAGDWQFTGLSATDGRGVAKFKVKPGEFEVYGQCLTDDGQTCEYLEIGVSGMGKGELGFSLSNYGAQVAD